MLKFPKMPNLWRKSVYIRILIVFFFAIIPIFFVGICVFSWGISLIRQQTIDSKAAQLGFYVENLEANVQRLVELQSDYNKSVELNVLSNTYTIMTKYDQSRNILALQKELLAIKSSSIYTQNVVAFIPTIQKKIDAVNGFDDMTGDDNSMMKINNLTSSGSQVIYYNGGLYTNTVYMIGTKKTLYGILIQISTRQLQEDISQFNFDRGSSAMIYSPITHSIVASSGNKSAVIQSEAADFATQHLSLNVGKGFFSSTINHKKYLVLYVQSQYLGFTLYSFVPESAIMLPINRYQFWFWIFTASAAIIIAFFSLSIYKIIKQPLSRLIQAFIRVDRGDISFSIFHKNNDEFASLYNYFNIMLQNLNNLINQSYKQKIMIQKAELKQLQAQINPHFLYNSYFLLHRMIKQHDYDKATLFSKHMGSYFQFITRSGKSEVPLEKEAEHARIYTDMQAMRYESRISVEFGDLPDGAGEIIVPRLILQPIIENAFEHGLKDKVADGLFRVTFQKLANGICIVVEDNGEDLSDDGLKDLQEKIRNETDIGEITGIINIHHRLQIMFGENSGLRAGRSGLGGLCISLYIRPSQQ